MIYRNDPYLDAQFQKAVQAAHNQDWDTFEHSSFYDARMMEDLLYVCEDFMPLEAKCRFALEHYDNHGDHSPIIRKYVRRARIIRPENWRDALPESVRDLDTFTIYRGSSSDISRAPLSLSWSLSYDVAEWFARRNNFLYQLPVHVYQATTNPIIWGCIFYVFTGRIFANLLTFHRLFLAAQFLSIKIVSQKAGEYNYLLHRFPGYSAIENTLI